MEHNEQPEEPAVRDLEPLLEWFTGNGQEHRAYQAIEKGDYEEARRLLEPVAARNSVCSLLTLGGFYEAGNLGPRDLERALSYYQRAANQGSAEASRRLGRLLLEHGNDDEARAAFEHGAEAGNISCMFWLGKMMVEGRGGDVEIIRGTEWLEVAAAEGQIWAERKLLVLKRQRVDSILGKVLIQGQIFALAKDLAKEVWRDADSDKVR